MPSGKSAVMRLDRLLDVAAEGQDVAALPHGDGKADGRLAVDAEQRLRRVGEATADVGNVAQPDHSAAGDEVDVAQILLGLEGAGDAQQQLFVAGLDDAGGADDVLRLQRGNQRRPVDAEAGEALHRKLDEHALILRAEHLDLGDVGNQQQLGADIVDVVAQFALGEAVSGEAVDDAVGVAEFVVEAGADDAGRQRVAHVADVLADMVPDVRHLAWPAWRPSG